MLDAVQSCLTAGQNLETTLLASGQRRLRPVLMTSLWVCFRWLTVSVQLKPLAIAVIGALCLSVLLSLIATPTVYFLLVRSRSRSG